VQQRCKIHRRFEQVELTGIDFREIEKIADMMN
jgi:hypothetical protein